MPNSTIFSKNNRHSVSMAENKLLTVNFGPQHPAAHGVLRLLTAVDGEIVRHVDPHIGLLHRGTEKLIEIKTHLQALPYFDRLDYVSMMAQEHAFSLAIERLCGLTVPEYSQIIRVIFLELTRVLNHLLAITTHALDVGAITPFFWGFEERERIMEFYERVSGARMHAAFIRPGGISQAITTELYQDIFDFCFQFWDRVPEFMEMLNTNRIWYERLNGIGVISAEEALSRGFSGVMLRGSGLIWDLRQNMPYDCYPLIKLYIPSSNRGDCYGRYLVRMAEMLYSTYIVHDLVWIAYYEREYADYILHYNKRFSKRTIHRYMESLIYHFKAKTSGIHHKKGVNEVYVTTEAPKGEFGVYLILDPITKIYRCRIRAPGFLHLQGLESMCVSHALADLVTIIGTQDIVFGEVDR